LFDIMTHIKVLGMVILLCIACTNRAPELEESNLSASEIMAKAHVNAGGKFWSQPKSLVLKGHGIFYQGQDTFLHETHNMYRIYEATKKEAHSANGKVRIESFRNGDPIILLSFDGQNTYDQNGKQAQSDADKRWASNFGYGVIRHAFDENYSLSLLGIDTIKGNTTFTIEITDPNQGKTIFDITQESFDIVKVAFDTPRGYHHRLYSKFFKKEKYNWNQAGLVELYYNDVKTTEILWEDFEVNVDLNDGLFLIESISEMSYEL